MALLIILNKSCLIQEIFIGEDGIISLNTNANRWEIACNLTPEFWNKGYATEITKELIRHIPMDERQYCHLSCPLEPRRECRIDVKKMKNVEAGDAIPAGFIGIGVFENF